MTAGIALLAIALIALIVNWAGSGATNRSGSRVHCGSPRSRSAEVVEIKGRCVLRLNVQKLTFGMTKQQVRHILGRPQLIAGECWQYPENVKDFFGDTINAVRVCFSYNVYSTQYYQELNGKWRDPRSSLIVIAPPTH